MSEAEREGMVGNGGVLAARAGSVALEGEGSERARGEGRR